VRPTLRVLGVIAACVILAATPAACGGNAGATGASTHTKAWVGNFYLQSGQESWVLLKVDEARELKVLVEVEHPLLKWELTGHDVVGTQREVKVTVVPTEGSSHKLGHHTVYAIRSSEPLKPGSYRLSVWGQGKVVYLYCAQ
jgi:hypothetical protein